MEVMASVDAAAARTGNRLAFALIGYFGLVTVVITLSPFDFSTRPVHLSWMMSPSDIIANIALFLPIGFLCRSLGNRSLRRTWQDVSLAAAFSLLLESAQIFIEGRFVSPIDVATNTCGAYLGVLLRDRIERWSAWRPQVVGRIGLDIPLVGLLYLLVPQLWLSGVGLVEDYRRSATMLLLGCAGSIVLVALHRHRWQGGVRLAARVVPPLAFLWFALGALPTLSGSPRSVAAMALTVVAVTCLLMWPPREAATRRFEVETLSRFLPVFMLYLVLSALWPPFRPFAPWHGAVGFSNRLNDAGIVDVLLLLEQVGGFTLLGYATAEWRGRRELSLADDLPRVTLVALTLAVALELMQGALVGPGASLLRAFLSTSAALYGAAVYHLARAHVRVLRADQPSCAVEHPRAA
jgi:glycopeptide antibiotics resistance protein